MLRHPRSQSLVEKFIIICCSQQRPDRPASVCSGSYCKALFYKGERGERGMKGGDGGNAGKPGKK